MSINPLIGFTVCSCFLIWVCLYRVCFRLQEQSTFKVFWLIGPKNLMQTHNIKVHPGSIPNVSTVHTTFSIETCIWRTLVHSRRGCPLNTGFTASLRAVTGLNVWRSLPHNERLQGWFKQCLTILRSKSTLIGSPWPLQKLPRNSLHDHSPIFFFPKAEPLRLRIFPEGVATHPYWSDLVIENEKSKINKLVSIVFINLFMIIILLIPMKDEKKFSHNFFIDQLDAIYSQTLKIVYFPELIAFSF